MTTLTLTERLAAQRRQAARPHVMRADIGLEEQASQYGISFTEEFVNHYWVAKLWGRVSTGEAVEMTRTRNTAAEALADLEAAITEQGWEIR